MKIAVANSVGIDKNGYYIIHSPSRWSWGQKNNREAFTYYPWELAYTCSLLKRETDYKIKFFDGCLYKYDFDKYYAVLKKFNPDYLIMEPSARTIEEDKSLMLKLKKNCKTKLIVCGGYATAFPTDVSKWADYICMGEYEMTVHDILTDKKKIKGLYPGGLRDALDINFLPWPEDSDVSRFDYALPGEPNCEYVEIQAYASRGCPMKCNFCVAGNLYYKRADWRPRNIDNIISEIKYLRKKYPRMEGIFFDEEVHTGSKKFIMDLTGEIVKKKLDKLKYNAMTGYYNLDGDMLEALKRAGYYKLRIGIETASEKTARACGMIKKFDIKKLDRVLREAKETGMKIYGTFTIGAKGSSYRKDIETGKLLKHYVELGLIRDVQVSINTPQPGTPFYKWADKNGYLLTKDWMKYDGGDNPVVNRPGYTADKVKKSFLRVLKYYDEGLEFRETKKLINIFMKKLKELDIDLNNVLLFRSNRMWHIRIFIKALKKYNRNIKIDIIGQPVIEDSLKKIKNISGIYIYKSGFFNYKKFFSEFGIKDFKNKYDASFIFINNNNGTGYVELLKITKKISNNNYKVYSNGKIEV